MVETAEPTDTTMVISASAQGPGVPRDADITGLGCPRTPATQLGVNKAAAESFWTGRQEAPGSGVGQVGEEGDGGLALAFFLFCFVVLFCFVFVKNHYFSITSEPMAILHNRRSPEPVLPFC
jgi:hypothetical protein